MTRKKSNFYVYRKADLVADKGLREQCFSELLAHLERGLSVASFPYLGESRVREMLSEYPLEFDSEAFDAALRRGQHYWEGLGRAQADGSCQGNARTWAFNMCNRYHWTDKHDIKAAHSGNVSVSVVNYSPKE